MSSGQEFITVAETARSLGVTVQQVRRLTRSGELNLMARGLVDRTSVERYTAMQHGGRTRVWAEPTAWGAVALLSGAEASWLGQVQASRLRAALRSITAPAELIARTRARARTRTFTAHPSAIPKLRKVMAVPDSASLGLVTSAGEPDRLEGYLPANQLDTVVRDFGLRSEPRGTTVVRTTAFAFAVIEDLATHSAVLAALDSAASLDPRVRGVGEHLLVAHLDAFRR